MQRSSVYILLQEYTSLIQMQPHIRAYKQTDKEACLQAFISNVPQFFTEAEIADFSNFLDQFHLINANIKNKVLCSNI